MNKRDKHSSPVLRQTLKLSPLSLALLVAMPAHAQKELVDINLPPVDYAATNISGNYLAQLDSRLLEAVEVAQLDSRLLFPLELTQLDTRLLEPIELAQVDQRLLTPIEVAQLDSRLLAPIEVAQIDQRLLNPIEVAQLDSRLLAPIEVAQIDQRLLNPIEVAQVDQRLLSEPVEVAINKAPEPVTYNLAFLQGGSSMASSVDMLVQGSSLLPGNYELDVYVNQRPFGRQSLTFNVNPGNSLSEPCFSLANMKALGVRVDDDLRKKILTEDPDDLSCYFFEQFFVEKNSTQVDIDASRFRVFLTAPQAYIINNEDGSFVEPALWSDGVTTAFTSYGLAYRATGGSEGSSLYNVTLENGVNVLGFRVRNTGSYSYTDGQGSYTNGETYVQHDIDFLKSQLTAGEIFSDGGFFDAVRVKGVKLETDSMMFPDNTFTYRPKVTGIAQSNAVIELRQSGLLIHTENVPPGPFDILKFAYRANQGDIELTIIEQDGSRRVSIVPSGTLPLLLPKGRFKYNATAGRVNITTENTNLIDPKINLGVLSVSYGLDDALTVTGGVQVAKGYSAVNVGASLLTELGAISVDTTFSKAKTSSQDFSGSSIRVRYSKALTDFNTSVAVAAQTFTSERYIGLNQYVLAESQPDTMIEPGAGLRYQTSISLQQPLGEKSQYGNLSLSAVQSRTWRGQTNNSFSLGYGINVNKVNLTFNVSRSQRQDDISVNQTTNETVFGVGVGIPVYLFETRHGVNTRYQRNQKSGSSNLSLSLNGTVPFAQDFSYGLQAFRNSAGTNASGESVRYTGTNLSIATSSSPIGGFSAYYGASSGQSSYGFSTSGSLVLHRGGLNMASGSLGSGFVLVDTGAAGITLNNGGKSGLNGFAIAPGINPYRTNLIAANKINIDADIDLISASDVVVPRRGLATLAKFEVSKGRRVRFELLDDQGKELPFGTFVNLEDGTPIGVADPEGLALVLLKEPQGQLTLKWGDKSCVAEYALKEKPANVNFESKSLQCTTAAVTGDITKQLDDVPVLDVEQSGRVEPSSSLDTLDLVPSAPKAGSEPSSKPSNGSEMLVPTRPDTISSPRSGAPQDSFSDLETPLNELSLWNEQAPDSVSPLRKLKSKKELTSKQDRQPGMVGNTYSIRLEKRPVQNPSAQFSIDAKTYQAIKTLGVKPLQIVYSK